MVLRVSVSNSPCNCASSSAGPFCLFPKSTSSHETICSWLQSSLNYQQQHSIPSHPWTSLTYHVHERNNKTHKRTPRCPAATLATSFSYKKRQAVFSMIRVQKGTASPSMRVSRMMCSSFAFIERSVENALAESLCPPLHPCAQCVDWLNVSNKLRAMPLARKHVFFCSWNTSDFRLWQLFFPLHDLAISVSIVSREIWILLSSCSLYI